MKTKVRLTAVDIMALVAEMKPKLLNCRLSNIYNVDAKTYIFKFSLPDSKSYLIVENGMRFNLADKIDKNKVPSGFTMKFRKFLRSRRLESIEQIGVERVIVFTFGREDHTYHLILELYSQGNIILADKDYRIIQLTRQHEFTEQAKVAPNEIYPFEYTATNYIEKFDTTIEHITKVCGEKTYKFKEILFKIVPCLHASLTDDVIQKCGFNPNEKITNQFANVKKAVDCAMEYLHQFRQKQHYKGYIASRNPPKENEKLKYFDFAPDIANYHKDKYVEEYETFNEAVNLYFEKVDRMDDNKPTIEEIAWKKFENIKLDQMSRINKLQQEQDEFLIKARLIEENIDDVQAILDIIEKMVEAGIPWDKIQKMINDSKKEGNPLSNLISSMNLKSNKITVLLGEKNDEYSELQQIEIDIGQSAYQNARKYFENKKKHKQKEDKTKEAVDQALKQAEKTAMKEIEREKNKVQKITNARKRYWFEKFYWFISTDGYLVISGRDVQQNEMIVKKYLNKDDIYMHADIHGSASTIIKNPSTTPIPDFTIQQAATATICRSKAWDAKIVVSAWWVYASQVTKSAPAGLFIPAGSFMIYGKKNFVYPPRLEMGGTVLYQLDQESIKRHEEERLKKQQEELQLEQPQLEQQESETTEKNILDSDEDQDQEEQNNEKPNEEQQEEGGQVKTIMQGGQEVTIVEVNPNARLIQERNDKKQLEKLLPEEERQKEVKPPKVNKQKEQQQKKNQPQQQQKQIQQLQQLQQPQQQKQDKNKNKQVEKEEEKPTQQQLLQIAQKNKVKKQKQQKAKEKYGDQSDEERELQMKLMGATYMKGEKKPVKQKGKQQKQQEELKNQSKEDYQAAYKLKQQESITEKILKEQGIAVSKEDEEKQQQNIQQNKVDEELKKDQIQKEQQDKAQIEEIAQNEEIEQIKQLQELQQTEKQEQKEEIPLNQKEVKQDKKKKKQKDLENEEMQQGEDENIEYTEMQKMVSYLYQDDVYLSLIPMVAPYQVIATNKFKIKIAPGSLKKGKAGKEILNYFLSLKDCTQQERQFLKLITDEEIVQSMLSGVKLTGAGMLYLKQKEKQQKKLQPKK